MITIKDISRYEQYCCDNIFDMIYDESSALSEISTIPADIPVYGLHRCLVKLKVPNHHKFELNLFDYTCDYGAFPRDVGLRVITKFKSNLSTAFSNKHLCQYSEKYDIYLGYAVFKTGRNSHWTRSI